MNSGLAMPLPHHAATLHRHWLRRQAIFLLLLTLHKLFIMQRYFFNYYYHYYLRFALFFVHRKMIRVGSIVNSMYWHTTSPRLDGGASSTLHYPMSGTSASLCRRALTVLCHHFGVSSSPLRHLGTSLGDGTLPRIKLGPRHQYQTH